MNPYLRRLLSAFSAIPLLKIQAIAFLASLAWSFRQRLNISSAATNQVALAQIRQALANLLFGRGILHS